MIIIPKKIVLKNGKEYGCFYGTTGFDRDKNIIEFNEDEILEIVQDNTLAIGDRIVEYYKGCIGEIISRRYSDWSWSWQYRARLSDGREVEFSEGYGYYKLYD